MEKTAYLALAETEKQGWYYQVRRDILKNLLDEFFAKEKPIRPPQILDMGAGTGGSSVLLETYGELTACEPSDLARQLAQAAHPKLKLFPYAIEAIPKSWQQHYDLIVLLCVLYHQEIKDPKASLRQLSEAQKPGGLLLWNEPAYPFLFRQHDRQTQAARRFYRHEMQTMLHEAGYELLSSTAILVWAFPFALVLAVLDRCQTFLGLHQTKSAEGLDHSLQSKLFGKFLRWLSYTEWRVGKACGIRLWGVSHLILARKL